mgnify:CR=1 FL=1
MDTPFYAELVKKLTNPMKQKPYKESSVKPVFAYLKNLNGGVPPKSIDYLLDRPLVLTRLEKYAVNTQRSIVFAIRNIAKDFNRQDVLDTWKENIEETEAGKGLPEPNEKSEKNLEQRNLFLNQATLEIHRILLPMTIMVIYTLAKMMSMTISMNTRMLV